MQEAPKFANKIGYSDIEPCEVVRVVSDKCLEIRRMKAERDPAWKPEILPGGFAGVCVNQSSQKWVIQSDPSAPCSASGSASRDSGSRPVAAGSSQIANPSSSTTTTSKSRGSGPLPQGTTPCPTSATPSKMPSP